MLIVDIILNHMNDKAVDCFYDLDTDMVACAFCRTGIKISEVEYDIYNNYYWKLWELMSNIIKIC